MTLPDLLRRKLDLARRLQDAEGDLEPDELRRELDGLEPLIRDAREQARRARQPRRPTWTRDGRRMAAGADG